MTVSLITNHGWPHGELDEAASMRSDLEIYDKSLKKAENWVIHPCGGARTRFSTQLCGFLDPNVVYLNIKIPFVYGTGDYFIAFGKDTIATPVTYKGYLYSFDSDFNITLAYSMTGFTAAEWASLLVADSENRIKYLIQDKKIYVTCKEYAFTCLFDTSPIALIVGGPTSLYSPISPPTFVFDNNIDSTVFQISNVTAEVGELVNLTITTMGTFGGFTEYFVGGIFEALGPKDSNTLGKALIYVFQSSTVVTIQIISPFKGYEGTSPAVGNFNGCDYLSEQAYNIVRGYPADVAMFQNRLILAGGGQTPLAYFLSKIGDYGNFKTVSASDAADPIERSMIAHGHTDAIQNIIISRSMVSLNSENESATSVWNMGEITPDSFNCTPQTYVGSTTTTPVVFDNRIIYVKKGGQGIWAFEYGNTPNTYDSYDACETSNHLIKNPKTLLRYTSNPSHASNMLIGINEDGTAFAWESLKIQNVSAWTPFKHANTDIKFTNAINIRDEVIFFGESAMKTEVLRLKWLPICGDSLQTCTSLGGSTVDWVIPQSPSVSLPYDVWIVDKGNCLLFPRLETQIDVGPPVQQYITLPYEIEMSDDAVVYAGHEFEYDLSTLPVHLMTQSGDNILLKKKVIEAYIKYMDSFAFKLNGVEVPTDATLVGTEAFPGNYVSATPMKPSSGIAMMPILHNGFTREGTSMQITGSGLMVFILGITLKTTVN